MFFFFFLSLSLSPSNNICTAVQWEIKRVQESLESAWVAARMCEEKKKKEVRAENCYNSLKMLLLGLQRNGTYILLHEAAIGVISENYMPRRHRCCHLLYISHPSSSLNLSGQEHILVAISDTSVSVRLMSRAWWASCAAHWVTRDSCHIVRILYAAGMGK